MIEIDETSPYGVHNLPYGSYVIDGGTPRIGVRYGDHVLDLASLVDDASLVAETLDPLLASGPARWAEVRAAVVAAVTAGVPDEVAHPLSSVRLQLPFTVGDYVDFYASEHHATNLGTLFRPGQPPLMPNWKHLPVGYHGRGGTVVVSGTDIRRPQGQRKGPEDQPVFGPSTRLDIECELGFVVGVGSSLGTPVGVDDFDDHVFGVVLLDDWSARDIQAWEYVPLGPHLGKSFATTISPWVVPMAALSQARVPTPDQGRKLPYLTMTQPWGLAIDCEVHWNGQLVSRPPYAETYWSPAQMLAHLTVNGASIRPGDLFASGTISGPDRDTRGAFIELTWGGAEPITVNGEDRTFLLDGDEVVLTASAPGPHGSLIGFGECAGRILPAH